MIAMSGNKVRISTKGVARFSFDTGWTEILLCDPDLVTKMKRIINNSYEQG